MPSQAKLSRVSPEALAVHEVVFLCVDFSTYYLHKESTLIYYYTPPQRICCYLWPTDGRSWMLDPPCGVGDLLTSRGWEENVEIKQT